MTEMSDEVQRMRPARFIQPDGILRPYVRLEAEGSQILKVFMVFEQTQQILCCACATICNVTCAVFAYPLCRIWLVHCTRAWQADILCNRLFQLPALLPMVNWHWTFVGLPDVDLCWHRWCVRIFWVPTGIHLLQLFKPVSIICHLYLFSVFLNYLQDQRACEIIFFMCNRANGLSVELFLVKLVVCSILMKWCLLIKVGVAPTSVINIPFMKLLTSC